MRSILAATYLLRVPGNDLIALSQAHGFQELSLGRGRLVAIALRVEIERRLNLAMTQDALHGLGSTLALLTSQLLKECRRL